MSQFLARSIDPNQTDALLEVVTQQITLLTFDQTSTTILLAGLAHHPIALGQLGTPKAIVLLKQSGESNLIVQPRHSDPRQHRSPSLWSPSHNLLVSSVAAFSTSTSPSSSKKPRAGNSRLTRSP